MADFNLDEYKQKSDDYFNSLKTQQDQRVQNRLENRQRYSVELTDEQYATFNQAIANSPNPDEEAHKIGLAITYANQLGITVPEAYQNVDNYNEALFGKDKSTSYRNWWTVVGDALSMGQNNVQIGQLGNELRRATKRGDEEGANVAREAIKAYQADNETKYDNAPRSWTTNVLKNGAQSLPYTGYVAGAAMFGGLIAGPVGTAAAFVSSSELMAGQEYVDMMDAGFSHEIAAPYSLISGGMQGLVEASLGEVMSFAGAGGKLIGKNVGNKLTSNAIDKTADAITKTMQTKLHFGPAKKHIVRALVEYMYNLPEEGAEEFLQTVISENMQNSAANKENKLRMAQRDEEAEAIALDKAAGVITDAVAADLLASLQEEYPQLEITEGSQIFKDALEDFKGGVQGAIALGFIPMAGNTLADARKVTKVKRLAETMDSRATFYSEMKKSRVDENGKTYSYADILGVENKAELNGVLNDIWEDASSRRQETNFSSVKEYVELNGNAEGYADAEIDEETGDKIIEPVERNEQGELDTESVVTENEDGTSNFSYRIGTTKKEGKNLYGYIDGKIDKENNKITINKFSMNENYEGLRQEAYEQFAADNAGYEIDWSPVTKHGKIVKDQLINNNLNGKNRGLSYYKDVEDLADSNVRREVAKKVRTKMTNIQSFEVPVAVAYMENLAKARGMTLNTWYKKTFTEDFIGDEEQGKIAAEAKGDTWEDVAGATDWKVIGNEVKAIIYAGKTADLSTFIHEVAHAWQGEMSRAAAKGDQNAIELRDKLEAAFNVKDHDWRHSEYTFKNGEVTTADEALAYGIQDFLKNGDVEDKSLSNTFKQLAMFIANCINSLKDFIDLSPEILDAYNSMLSGDDSYLAKAQRDAAKAEREIKQNEKKASEEKQQQEQTAAEEKAKETEETNFKTEEETQQEEEAPVENIPPAEEVAAEVEKQNETTMDVTTEDVLQNVQEAAIQEEIKDDVAGTVEEAEIDPEVVDALLSGVAPLSKKQDIITEIADEEQLLDDEYDGPIFQKRNKDYVSLASKEDVGRVLDLLKDTNLFDEKEAERIKGNLDTLGNTPYYDSLVWSINIRKDLIDLLSTGTLREGSKLNSDKLKKVVRYCKNGYQGVIDYFENESSIISHPSKCVFAITSSFINCNPSLECAKWCYAATGTGGFTSNIVRGELVDLLIKHEAENGVYDKVGEHSITDTIADQWLNSEYGKKGYHLRILDKGDVSKYWLPFIKRLNDLGVGLTIFTKRADLIDQIDSEKNIVMYSVDKSNVEDALKYPNLKNLAVVWTGPEDDAMLERLKDKIAVILPAKIKGSDLNVKESIKALPKWTLAHTCPIDAEWKHVKDQYGNPSYNCTKCELNGWACYMTRGIKSANKLSASVLRISVGELNEKDNRVIDNIKERLPGIPAGELELIRQIIIESNIEQYGDAYRRGIDGRLTEGSTGNRQVQNLEGNTSRILSGLGLQKQKRNTEVDAVRAQYENTDKWMKAPNGKDTNLSEKQWLQVRTPSFKKWFGDWENDPANSSQVVDANGEPMVVYHGSKKAGFSVFESNDENRHSDAPENSYWFAGNRHQAYSYSGSYDNPKYEENVSEDDFFENKPGIYEVFLNIRTPEYEDFEGATWNGDTYDKYQLWDLTNTDQWEEPVYTKENKRFFDSREEAEAYAEELGITNYEIQENPWLGMSTNSVVEEAARGDYGDDIDGVIIENVTDPGPEYDTYDDTDYIVFNPEQIKSATDNIGTFDNSNLDIRYQKTLYGVHNLSEEALKHVLKMGGLANPSIAVVDKNKSDFRSFGDISLIAYSSLINKSTGGNAGTFGADIYSPRYPNVQVETTEAGDKTIDDKLSLIKYNDLRDRVSQAFRNELERNKLYPLDDGLSIMYMAEQGKLDDFVQFNKGKYSNEITEKFKNIGLNYSMDIFSEDEKAKQLSDLYLNDVEIPNYISKGMDEADARDVAKRFFNVEGKPEILNYNILKSFFSELDWQIKNANKVDYYETREAIRKYLEENNQIDNFNKWVEDFRSSIDVEEKIFNGFTPSGNRRYIAHTLENVSKYMKAEGLRAGESFNYGMGSVRATITPKFTTLKQIHDAKDRIVSKDEFEEAKAELENTFTEIVEELSGSNYDYDVGTARLVEAFTTKGVNPIEYLRNEYDLAISDDRGNEIIQFMQDLRDLPTEYFETKFEKPIYTEDFGTSFAAAVVPKYLDKELVKTLSDMGIAVFEYGDEDRKDVIANVIDTLSQTRNIAFQTQSELYADAMNFDNWKDFMDSYVNEFDPVALEDPMYHSQVPEAADAQWYQTVWELAHKVIPEESKNITELEEKLAKEGPIPTVMDAMFDTDMATIPGMLEDFLLKIYEIRQIDFNSQDFLNPADEEESRYFDKLQELQDYINTRLSNVTFLTQATHYATTGEITTPTRNRMLSLIEANSREYRALYSEIMEDDKYAVDPEDLPRRYLEKKLRKYRLVSPNADLERKSIDEIGRLAQELENREMADKIARKKLKMDDELSKYFDLLKKQVDELQKAYDEKEKETTGDYQRIANDEKRKLLKYFEKLQKLKIEIPKYNEKLQRLIDKGLKISGKYKQNVQNYKADYDEIFRKYQDLYSTVEITKEVEAALNRIKDKEIIRSQLEMKKKEKDVVDKLKRLRIQLVKRTMRRVPFEKIDYESARTLIAIQRMLEPNLFGGVNRWIGVEGPELREVMANILIDEDYKKDILKYLDNHAKASQAFNNFKTLLLETKTMAQFNKWTQKQRADAIRYLPKENWIKELNLKQLAKEREESIDLPIEMIQVKKPLKDENGNIIETKDGTPYMATTFELQVDPELAATVKDAVGENMYYNIISRPFAEWRLDEMEELAVRVNQIYIEGRDNLAAKKALKQKEAAEIRARIEAAVKNTGIVINDDDTPEEKAKKQEKIDKILGLNSSLHGTNADKKKENRFNRLLHSYNDATVLRVARILDNYTDGENVKELYIKENECYNAKHRSINARAESIQKLMKENKITEDLLAQEVVMHDAISNTDYSFTIDELLYIKAANADYVDDEIKLAKYGAVPGSLEANDDYAPTSRNAVMFGNMLATTKDIQKKEEYAQMDKQMSSLIDAEDPEVMQMEALNTLDRTPGTTAYKAECKARFAAALSKANEVMQEHPELEKLAAAIADDYATQYGRMNEISVEVLNSPVHRVKAYVPLVRLESNGETNENQLKEDLLGVSGLGKEYVNKGMTKRRVSIPPLQQKPVQMGLHKTWANSVERTEHFIAYSEYVRELNSVYKARDAQYTKNFIESRYGKEMMDYINSYINEVANPNANRVRTAGDELIRTLRGKTAPAYLAWKVSAVIKQGCTSPWPYMQFVTPAEYLAASWKLTTSKGALYDAIREKSVFMKNRVMDPMNDLIKELADSNKGNKVTRKLNKINEKGMAGLEWIDWICVAPGWYACYLKKFNEVNGNNKDVYEATKLRLKEENATVDVASSQWLSAEKIEALAIQAQKDDVEKQAVDYADFCTRQCQPSNRATDIAPLFKNSSEAMKAYLQFQTSLNVIWNNIRYDSVYAVKNKQFWRLAGCIVGYVAAGIMMNAVIDGWPNGDDDDPEDVLKQFIWYSTTQFTDSVPMIGSALSTANQKLITGKSTYFGSSGTDMTPMVTKFINATTSTASAIRNAEDEEKAKQAWMKAASNFVEGVNMNLGLPVSGLKEVGKLAGVGNKEPGLDLDLGSVYGVVNNITGKENK